MFDCFLHFFALICTLDTAGPVIIIFGNKLCPEYQYLTKVYGLDFVYVFVTSKQEKKLMQLTRGEGRKRFIFYWLYKKIYISNLGGGRILFVSFYFLSNKSTIKSWFSKSKGKLGLQYQPQHGFENRFLNKNKA